MRIKFYGVLLRFVLYRVKLFQLSPMLCFNLGYHLLHQRYQSVELVEGEPVLNTQGNEERENLGCHHLFSYTELLVT